MKQILKPCPLCGSEVKLGKDDFGFFNIHCTKCPLDFGRFWYPTKSSVTKAWNSRT